MADEKTQNLLDAASTCANAIKNGTQKDIFQNAESISNAVEKLTKAALETEQIIIGKKNKEDMVDIDELEYAFYVLVGRHLGLQAVLSSFIRQENDEKMTQKLLSELDRVESSVYWGKFKKALKKDNSSREQYHVRAISDGFSDLQDNFTRDLRH